MSFKYICDIRLDSFFKLRYGSYFEENDAMFSQTQPTLVFPKKILVTGGCGFLGQYLILELQKIFPNTLIFVLDLKKNDHTLCEILVPQKINYILGKDITHFQSIQSSFLGVDLVIHLAGKISFSYIDRIQLKEVNAIGTRNVVRAAEEAKVAKLLHISSVAAFGYTNDPRVFATEEFQFNWDIAKRKNKHYMLSKRAADLEVMEARKRRLDATIIAPGLLFGPGDLTNSAKLIQAIQARKIPFNPPGGTNIVDVRDVARGIAQSVMKKLPNPIYFLSGSNLQFTKIHQIIAETLNIPSPRFVLPQCLQAPLFFSLLMIEKLTKKRLKITADTILSSFCFRYFSHNLAKQDWQWEPQIPFATTIQHTIEWMKDYGLFKK